MFQLGLQLPIPTPPIHSCLACRRSHLRPICRLLPPKCRLLPLICRRPHPIFLLLRPACRLSPTYHLLCSICRPLRRLLRPSCRFLHLPSLTCRRPRSAGRPTGRCLRPTDLRPLLRAGTTRIFTISKLERISFTLWARKRIAGLPRMAASSLLVTTSPGLQIWRLLCARMGLCGWVHRMLIVSQSGRSLADTGPVFI